MVDAANPIAESDFEQAIRHQSQDKTDMLAKALGSLVASIKEVAGIAEVLNVNNCTNQLSVCSD